MSKGSSQPWQEILSQALGESRLDGNALREYFAPLEEWLRLENLRTNEYVGWNYDGDYCKRSIETANLQVFGGYYNSGTQFRHFYGNKYFLVMFILVFITKFWAHI